MNYAPFEKHVELLPDKKDKCSSKDGEFQTSVKIPTSHANLEKAKSLGWLFVKTEKGKMKKQDTKIIDLTWFTQCNIITQMDLQTFHDSLKNEEKFAIIKKAHLVEYQKVLTTSFLENMDYQAPSQKKDDLRKEGATKIIFDIKDGFVKALMNAGQSEKDAIKAYEKMRKDSNV